MGAIANVFYALVTLGIGIVAWSQLRALAASAKLQHVSMCAQTTLALLHEWNHDLWRARNDAHAHVGDLIALAKKGPKPLTELWKDHPYAVQMSHFLDKVGYMVEADYVDKGLVTAAFKSSAKFCWGVLEPFIREEAEKKHPDKKYQDYFKRLADP